MSHSDFPPISLICCSIFKLEVTELLAHEIPDFKVQYLNSMLHIRPDLLHRQLGKIVQAELSLGHKVLLIYGDCFPRMFQLEGLPGLLRTPGHNCCELLLGKSEYRRLEHDGVFFLIPEWARRWNEIFSHHLGLNSENAKGLMQDMHQKLVYLDTGLVPIPNSDLQACAEYCGLPVEVKQVSLDILFSNILDTYHRLIDQT